MFVSVIIAAAGQGERLGAGAPKQLLEVGGVSMLQRTVETFSRAAFINEIIVALPSALAKNPPAYLLGGVKPVQTVAGGARRQDSVANAFARVSPAADVVVVHDAARPFASEGLIRRTVDAARASGAAVAAVAAQDTVKEAAPFAPGGSPTVERTLTRDRIFLAQTPQAFRRDVLREAIALARQHHTEATDEAVLVERTGHAVQLVAGEPGNVKITTPEDFAMARLAAGAAMGARTRVGTGYDLHRLVEGRPFVLAGVTVPSALGPFGHSDGDVLCHAIADAALGAAVLGDIGRHFPDTEERWRGVAGLDLLARTAELIRHEGFTFVNVDAVVIVERPKLTGHTAEVRANLARVLGLEIADVSVKGKTNEGLGEIGRGEAIACHTVVLLQER